MLFKVLLFERTIPTLPLYIFISFLINYRVIKSLKFTPAKQICPKNSGIAIPFIIYLNFVNWMKNLMFNNCYLEFKS